MSNTPVLIDVNKTFDEFVRRSASLAEADAVVAEVNARHWQILNETMPGREDIETQLERATKISVARRRRANGLLIRAGVSLDELPVDSRVQIAFGLKAAQEAQVANEEKFENMDLYAVSAEEAILPRQMDSMPPETEAQIRLNTMQGRALVQAYVEWLEAHRNDSRPIEDSPMEPQRQQGVDALRKYLGIEVPTPEEDEDPD